MKNSILIIQASIALMLLLVIPGCEKLESNSWKELKPCPGTPTVEYGGQTYNTVQIGDQCWLAENLNIGAHIDGSLEQTDNDVIEKYCYNNDLSNCNTYGGLYTWDELIQYAEAVSYRGICPEGWAIPSESDWSKLPGIRFGYNTYDNTGIVEASENYWSDAKGGPNGTNATGFTALPGGNYHAPNTFEGIGSYARFWTVNRNKSFETSFRHVDFSETSSSSAFSVRCIKKNSPPVIKLITADSIDNNPINGKIEWEATDENNNQVYCNLYLKIGNSNFTTPVVTNTTQSIFVADELLYGGKYFWQVMATDNVDTTWSEIRMFRTEGQPCPDVSQVHYMGKTYNTIKIGDQCWMRENLDAGTMVNFGEPSGDNGVIEKFCRNNNPQNCEVYGGLYTWDEMMQYTLDESTQGICPDGWHLPTKNDFQELISHIGLNWESGGALKEMGTEHWKAPNTGATNHSGFTLLPSTSGSDYNKEAKIWSTRRDDSWYPWDEVKAIALTVHFDFNHYHLDGEFYLDSQTGSVRCIKNN